MLQLALVHVHNQQKPLTGPHPAPWNATQQQAVLSTYQPGYADVVTRLERLTPSTCLGAVLRSNDPGFLLFGSRLQRRVEFPPVRGVVAAARDRGLGQVVVGQFTKTRRELAAAGWRVQILGDSQDAPWLLATARGDSAPQNRCS